MKINWNPMITYYSLCFLFLVTLLSINAAVAVAAAKKSYECDGSMAECGEIVDEFSVESEISERALARAKKYISPGALRADLPVCGSRNRGNPYTKTCVPRPSNPPQRGCSRIYRCRGGV